MHITLHLKNAFLSCSVFHSKNQRKNTFSCQIVLMDQKTALTSSFKRRWLTVNHLCIFNTKRLRFLQANLLHIVTRFVKLRSFSGAKNTWWRSFISCVWKINNSQNQSTTGLKISLLFVCFFACLFVYIFYPLHLNTSMQILHTVLHNFLRSWQGEFVKKSRTSLIGDHFLIMTSMCDSGMLR